MEVKIIDMDHKGNGLGKIDGKIVFVPKSIPGDIVNVTLVKQSKKYDVGRIDSFIIKSTDRIKEKCPYYMECGGCNILNLNYEKQLMFKVNKVKNIFKKYLNIEISPRVIGSKKVEEYRNKITFHNAYELGLIGEYLDIVPVDYCSLVSDKVNELYRMIKKEDTSKVKKITIREVDNGLILSIDGELNTDRLRNKCIEIYINNECVYSKERGYICLNELKFMISNAAFFQINTTNITNLYNEILRYGEFSKDMKVIDLYCGVGSISLYIAKYVKEVLGIEIVPEAIEDAKENAKINDIQNAKFICSDVYKLDIEELNGDVLIVDPPRIGLDKHVAEMINNSKITKVIYVSCDPMTLARDLAILNNYEIKESSVVDMFPGTHHCESIAILKRR